MFLRPELLLLWSRLAPHRTASLALGQSLPQPLHSAQTDRGNKSQKRHQEDTQKLQEQGRNSSLLHTHITSLPLHPALTPPLALPRRDPTKNVRTHDPPAVHEGVGKG